MSPEEWKAYLLAARQKNTQPSTVNTGQQMILHTHGEGNKSGKRKEKVKIGRITLLFPSYQSEPNEGVDVTSSTVMATDNPDADSPPNDEGVPSPKRAQTGKDKSKEKRIVSSKGPAKTDKLKCPEDIDKISIEEGRNMMLTYGLKAMSVGKLLTERQAKDLQVAQSKLTIADETLVEVQTKLEEVTEKFKREAKLRADLEDKRKEDIEKLKKDHEDEIKKLKQQFEKKNRALSNKNSEMKFSLTTKDQTLKELTKEKESWAEERKHHDGVVHELKLDQASMFQKGFDLALEQVKILFPDLDADILKEADSLKAIMDGKLVF
jgi:predicted  nucleic acid-binding Zn-ribbon protein